VLQTDSWKRTGVGALEMEKVAQAIEKKENLPNNVANAVLL